MRKGFLCLCAMGWMLSGCATIKASRPCTEGGQPAWDDKRVTVGTKKCEQYRAPKGNYLNHGKYLEYSTRGSLLLEGEYSAGKKTGKWVEWDEEGKKVSEKWYENGVETQGREKQPYNGLEPQPASMNPVTTKKS
jgi:hypothetical protein